MPFSSIYACLEPHSTFFDPYPFARSSERPNAWDGTLPLPCSVRPVRGDYGGTGWDTITGTACPGFASSAYWQPAWRFGIDGEPMQYTLGTAAKATGKSKPTIQRAIKAGRLSAVRKENRCL